MRNSYVIGVDIGGTNTDAVLVDQNKEIVYAVKTTTTGEISLGFSTALKQLLTHTDVPLQSIQGVFLGTTHATNAILENKNLFRVGVIRIAGQRPESLPVAFAWPQALKEAVIGGCETIAGGFECHGGALTPLCQQEAVQAIQRLLTTGVESIAITGVFSPLNGSQEKKVAAIVRELAGESIPISLSYEIGGIGFIERENSTILNAALKKVMEQGFLSLQMACQQMGLFCPIMVTQNDGSLIELERAINYPVLTISAGPTNSFMGATRLANLNNAIVVDIGGTSTDVGLVRSGFPVRSLNKSTIGGVNLNFSMPDVLSIALGGGSWVDLSQVGPKIGPKSVGKSLALQSLSFGGDQLTLTDVALFMQYVDIPESNLARIPIKEAEGSAVFTQVRTQIEELVLRMQGEYKNLPILFVGGGAALLPSSFSQGQYCIPAYFNVANAYGAALSEISGTVDAVVSLQNREEVLKDLCTEAQQKAIDQGANPLTLRLVDQQIIPYSYVPNQMARVVVRYCGQRMT